MLVPARSFQSMLFKFVGVVLQQCSKKSVVREKLDFLFANVDHNVTEDREVGTRRRAAFVPTPLRH